MKPLTFCLLVLCGSTFYAEAQINPGRVIERAAGRQLNRELNREMRESVEESDRERTKDDSDSKPAATYKFGADAKVKLQNFKIRRKDEKAEDPIFYRYYFPASGDYLGMKPLGEDKESMDMVILENKRTHSFVSQDGSKMRMSMNLERFMKRQNKQVVGTEDDEKFTIRHTGNTKTILGHSCDEYIIENEDKTHRSTYWLATVLEEQVQKLPLLFMSAGSYMSPHLKGNKGMVLEMEMIDEESKSRTTFEVTELNLNNKTTFDTQGYRSMGAAMFGN